MLDNKLTAILGLLLINSFVLDWSIVGFVALGMAVTMFIFWRFLVAHPGWAVFGFVVTCAMTLAFLSGNWWLERSTAAVLPLVGCLFVKKYITNPAPHEIEIPQQ